MLGVTTSGEGPVGERARWYPTLPQPLMGRQQDQRDGHERKKEQRMGGAGRTRRTCRLSLST